MDVRETAEALYRASSQIAIEKPKGVVLDDLGTVTSLSKDAFFNLIETARRASTSILVTSNLEPSSAVIATLGATADAATKIGNLTENEVTNFVSAKGGNPDRWARYVYVATGGGHPLLVDAMVRGLETQNWSIQELQELNAIVGNNRDVEEVKLEIRNRLFDELHDTESNLLSRLSLVFGAFDRKLAMFLGELDPEISRPGKAFDSLIGAWIETESKDRFRLSSLVSNLGGHTLGPKATTRLHHDLADYYTKDLKLDAGRFNDIILHGMIGKNAQALTIASLAIISAKSDAIDVIAKYSSTYLIFRTASPLYADDQRVSFFLRAAQLLLLVESGEVERFYTALEAFERENADMSDEISADLNASMFYTKAMSLPGLVKAIDDLSDFALTAAEHARKLEISFTQTELRRGTTVSSVNEYLQFMFAFQLSRISNFDTLQRVMKGLMAKTKVQREFLLKAFEADHFDKSLVIKYSWVRNTDESDIAKEGMANDYAALGRDLAKVGEDEFAMAAFESSAVIWDEYLKNPKQAILCLEEARGLLGDTQSVAKALSRIFLHEGRYEDQLEVGMPISKNFRGGSTETSFFFRELALGNSHLGDHGTARALYLRAYGSIVADPLKGNTPMAAGLLADAAVEAHWAGNSVEAVKLLIQALDAADALNPDDGLHSAAVIRLIAHSVVWLSLRIKGQESDDGQHVMVPGANSNPNPHEGLKGRMALPLDYVWYVLADIEAALDADCGAVDRLLSADWNARAVLTGEIFLYVSIASSAERRLLQQAYLRHMPRSIDAHIFTERNDAKLTGQELSSSPRKRVQLLRAEKFSEHRGRFARKILMFALRLAFQKSPAAAMEFVAQASALRRPLITKTMQDAFFEGQPSAANDEIALAGTVGCVVKTIVDQQTPAVVDLMLVSLRLFELTDREFCEASTIAKVKRWLLGRWQSALEDQAFQIISPRLAQQSLSDLDARAGEKLPDIADLVSTLLPFVKIKVSQNYKDWLAEKIAKRNDLKIAAD